MDREITSTVTVTESTPIDDTPPTTNLPSILPAPVKINATITDVPSILPIPATITHADTEGTLWVQTTGVSQGTPSDAEPAATNDTNESIETPSVPEGTPIIPEPSGPDEEPQPDPTTPPFTCPEDNGSTVSQMLGPERFDYDVYCDADLPKSSNIPVELSYDTFSECAAFCSISNRQFGEPVCQGVSYFEATSGTNCFLKSVANASDIAAATGVNVAILRRIAVGIDDANAEGTNTQTISFSEPTREPADVGSMLESMMGNSTSTVPFVTPPAIISGRPALDGVTAYSTYVSAGQTFSTGSAYSTYHSANGSWWWAVYSEWAIAWTDEATIYAAGETAIPIITNNTGVTQENGADGMYSEIKTENTTVISYQWNQTVYDTTTVIANNTFDADGAQIDASTTTLFYSYTQAAAGGGGVENSDAGVVTSTSLAQFSTQSVIRSSGIITGGGGISGGGGAISGGGSEVIQTPPPVLTSTSAFSTQTVVQSSGAAVGSGGISGGGNAASDAGSGDVTSTSISALSTEIVITSSGNAAGSGGGSGSGGEGSTLPVGTGNSVTLIAGGTAFSTGGVVSSGIVVNGTSGATSLGGSGGAVTTPAPITSTVTDTTVILSTGGSEGGFSTGASGAGNETSGATSFGNSGTFSNSNRPRSGTFSTTSTTAQPIPSESGPVPYPSPSTVSSGVVTSVNGSTPVPTGTSPFSFTNSQTLRTPGPSTESVFTGTGPIPYPPLSTGPSTETLPLNSSLLVPTGTAPPSNETLPVPTGSVFQSYSWTNSLGSRSGTTTTTPLGTGPIPYPPPSTAPSSDPPPSNSSLPVPTGSAPPSNSTIPGPTGTAPPSNETFSGGSSRSFTASFTGNPRSGTTTISQSQVVNSRPPVVQTLSLPPYQSWVTPSATGSSIALSTGGSASGTSSILLSSNGTTFAFPTATAPQATSCPSQTISTTTLYETRTVYACWDDCPRNSGGNYGGPFNNDPYGSGPRSFGPPAAIFAPTLSGDPNPPSTSAATETSA